MKDSNGRAVRLAVPILIAGVVLAGAAFPESPRAFQVLVFLAMLGALGATGTRVSRWLVPDWQPLNRAVAAFTFAVGVAVVPATWMGHFGVLRPAPFLAWTAAAYLLSRLLPERSAEAEPVFAPHMPTRTERAETALLLAAALAIALAGLREVHVRRYVPPGPYDDLSYHLSEAATWIRHGDLRMIRFSMGDPSTPFYPVLGEMAAWVLIAPFGDSDVAARWTQLPFALFSFLAAAAIVRRLGLSRRDAALAAVCYAGIEHVFPFLAMGAGNDHATSFFTLAAVDGSLALARRPRPGEAAVAGTALGLLLATKYVGLLFAPPVLAFLILAMAAGKGRPRARALAGLVLLVLAAMAVTGGYTYLRNAVTTGNPVFPAPVRILGREILPGWEGILPSSRMDTSPTARIDVPRFLTRTPELFGSYFPFTLLPAALLAPLLALGQRRWREALVLAFPAVFFLQFLHLMLDHRDNRYFLPGIALAAVAWAWLLARFGRRAFPLRAALLVWITWQAAHPFTGSDACRAVLTVALLGMGALLEIAWNRRQARDRSPRPRSRLARWRWIAAAGLPAAAALPLGSAVVTYQEVKLAGQPGLLALERLAGPDGARVAYAGFNQPYLFFGSRLQNDLQIVPRSPALDAQYYAWGNRLAKPWATGRYQRWQRNLQRRGIELVVVIRSAWEDPERRWMARHRQEFELLYGDGETEIWRFLPAGAAASGPAGADRPGRRRRGPGKGSTPAGESGPGSSVG